MAYNSKNIGALKELALSQLHTANEVNELIRNLLKIYQKMDDESELSEDLVKQIHRLLEISDDLASDAKRTGDIVKSSSVGGF